MTIKSQTLICFFAVLLTSLPSTELRSQDTDFLKKTITQMRVYLQQVVSASSNSSMVKELELDEDQGKVLRRISDEHNKQVYSLIMKARIAVTELRENEKIDQANKKNMIRKIMAERDTEISSLYVKTHKQLKEVLLPHQLNRIRQLALQSEMRTQYKGEGFVVILGLADRLGLSANEKQKLKEAVDKAQKEYQSELTKIQNKFNKRVVDSLPSEAKKKLEKLIGDFHYFKR